MEYIALNLLLSPPPPGGGLFTSNTFEAGEGRIFRKDDGISSSHSLILRRPRSVPFEKTSEVVRESKGTTNDLGRLRIRLFWEREGRERDRERPRTSENQAILREGGKRKGPRTTSDVWESGYSERGREAKGTANDLGRLRIRLFWEREGSERDRERPRTSENQAILREGGKRKGPRTTSDVWESGYSSQRIIITNWESLNSKRWRSCSRGSKTNPDF